MSFSAPAYGYGRTNTFETVIGRRTREKRNNLGDSWEDPTQVYESSYPSTTRYKPVPKRSHISNGWRPMLPYGMDAARWKYHSGSHDTEWAKNGWPNDEEQRDVWRGTQMGSFHFGDIRPAWGNVGIDNLIQQAKTECMNKLNDGKVNLGQMMAESRASAETLADTAGNLFKLITYAKHGQWSRIPKEFGRAKTISGMYLNYQYGWKPLMSDIHELHTQLQQSVVKRRHLLRAVRQVTGHSSGRQWDFNRWCDYSAQVVAKATIYAEVSSETLAKAASYGLVNPLALGWELVPYSFVVDWFMPIGNTLKSLSASAGLNFVDGCISLHKTGTVSIPGDNVGSATCEALQSERLIMSGFPSTIKPYAAQHPFSTQRVANSMALFNNLVFRK